MIINIITKIIIVNLIIIFTLILFYGVVTLFYFIVNFNLIGLGLAISNLAIQIYLLYILSKDKI